jgi:hypothetical protein
MGGGRYHPAGKPGDVVGEGRIERWNFTFSIPAGTKDNKAQE